MNVLEHKHPNYLALISISITPLSGLAVDIFSPSLPMVSHYFNTNSALAQLTITSYMIGLGFMQLFAGPISDTFGRRIPFLIGTCIFTLATLIIPYAQTIYQLIGLRVIQGITIAITIVPMRSVIPDLFEGKALYKWMNYMVTAWSLGPIIAPAIGGYLQHYFGWKSNFYFLAIYTIFTGLLVFFFLPETSKHRHAFRLCEIFKRYKTIMSTPEFIFSLLTNAALYSIIIIFTTVGPFLVQTTMHYSAVVFGYLALTSGLSWFIGTLTNRFLIEVDLNLKIKTCLWSMLAIALISLITSQFIALNIYSLIIPIVLITWLGGIIFPNNFARVVSLFPTMSGSTNALFGAFIFFIVGITSGLATNLKATHLAPLTLCYIGLIIICLIISYLRKL